MKRRSFTALLGIAPLALALPEPDPIVVHTPSTNHTYGWSPVYKDHLGYRGVPYIGVWYEESGEISEEGLGKALQQFRESRVEPSALKFNRRIK